MRLVALTYGTEGDTRLIAALCSALMEAGLETTLLADGGTPGSARDLGVLFQEQTQYSRLLIKHISYLINTLGKITLLLRPMDLDG